MSTSCSGLVRTYVACLRDTPCMKVRGGLALLAAQSVGCYFTISKRKVGLMCLLLH